MRLILLRRRKELVISAFIGFTANIIDESTLYTVLGVNNKAKKNY